MKNEAPDFILPYTYYPNILVAATVANEKRYVWNQRDCGIEGNTKSYYENRALRRCRTFIANSNAVKKYLMSTFHINEVFIKRINNGSELKQPIKNRIEWRTDLGIGESEKLFAMVANFHSNKDHRTLLTAWKEITRENRDVKLVLAGRYAGTENELMRMIDSLGIKDSVKMIDYTKDVSGLLSASDFFVFSSMNEGSPNGVIEAMLAGLPIVASDISPVREALGENYPFLFLPGDPDSLTQTMRSFLEQSVEDHKALGKNNFEKAREQFSTGKMASSYKELISSSN